MNIVIVKYNAGNIKSVDFALQRLGIHGEITNDHEKIRKADKVIFPGVGEASTTMKYLREHKLDVLLKELKQPVLGICLGLQLMCTYSEEGNTDCIGIFNEKVKRFEPRLKVPHMGWNSLGNLRTPLFKGDISGQYVYFVHSYYAELGPNTIAETDYINTFSSALHKDNFYATQFHPEKSGPVGEGILKNFIEL
ncbi:MAG: imidazole glycerol phosphate synthase subunit HisH [Bacteroidales bacterium]|nr:imidazole glycerol phosphate synthase subunit HisH [Bacteroidales bacterium]